MIKIGIITFHKSINYGAFMQAFSLSKRIQKDFPECLVNVVDYVPLRTINSNKAMLEQKCRWKNVSLKMKLFQLYGAITNPKGKEQTCEKIKAFMKNWECLPLSSEQYFTDDYEMVLEKISSKYDILIVGSDCVWEFVVDKFPNVYFLNNNNIKHKFSYAASSDRIVFDELDDFKINELNHSLSSFDYIGIRDISTQNLIHSINKELQFHHNCDPTIFLDLNDVPCEITMLKNKLKHKGIDLDKPIIGIMGDDNIGKLVKKMYGSQYQIVCVYTYTRYADAFLNDLTPFEWSHVFSLFSIVFTRYFHGTIMSLKNLVPTITLDPWKMKNNEHKTKIRDLYDRLNLDGHYFVKKKKYTKKEISEIKKKSDNFIMHPDKEEIRTALEKEKEYYNGFKSELRKCINEMLTDEV